MKCCRKKASSKSSIAIYEMAFLALCENYVIAL